MKPTKKQLKSLNFCVITLGEPFYGNINNKDEVQDEDPFATADFTNGVFTTTQDFASYGAKR